MKKLLIFSFMLFLALPITSCGGTESDPLLPENPQQPENPEPGNNHNNLVVYISRTGNTERVARQIQSVLDCDILEVEPAVPLEENYTEMVDRALAEFAAIDEEGDFPLINTSVEDFGKYDLIFVGYPIWGDRIATPMQSFLHSHASLLAGKRIALFATSGGSSITNSANEAKVLVPDAVFEEALLHNSSNQSRIVEWLNRLGIKTE